MKKLVILLFCLVSLHTNAYDFVDNGFRYTITSTSNLTVEVSGHENSKELFDLTIPNEATYSNKTFTVTGIGANSFSGLTNLNKVTIPNTITYIGASAFYG